ncbi:MAG TPA: hypothetical protein PKD32_12975 [Saprospiraceae bacterium]|nr:hypothetical protein [Saprospiraceae bacterium]
MESINYFDLENFKGLFLEDSFVLQIIEVPELISFQVEFVLTEDHPEYKKPLDDEMYCYRFGEINFKNPKQVIWKVKNQKAVSIDANGDNDLGNIDLFFKSGDDYSLEGDWGCVIINCENLEVKLKAQSPN